MNTSLKSKIEMRKSKNDELIVIISYCDFNFQGSQITFNSDFAIDPGEMPMDIVNRLIIGFDNPYIDRKLNIANEENYQLEFVECKIENKYPSLDIDFRGSSFSFDKCLVNKDAFEFNFKNSNYKLSQLRDGFFEIHQNQKIISKKTTVTFPQGVIVQSKDSDFGEFVFSLNTNLSNIQGSFEKIMVTQNDFQLNIENNCFIKLFQTPNYEFHSIECGVNGHIEVGQNKLILRLLDISSEIIIKNTRLNQFICDTCNFSKTKIDFQGNSSINFEGLESIATIWNPSEMRYREFCPKTFKQKINTRNSAAAREFFCELKNYFSSKKGDSITAGEFYCAEMIAHRSFIKEKQEGLSQDKFIMWASHISSKFGQSWLRAILCYGVSGFFFTIILLSLMGDMCARCFADWSTLHSFDCNFFWVFLLNVFSPLNLKLSDIIPTGSGLSSGSAWSMATWMLWKVIGGFLIFQIITSSRRFIRKW